ncbi:hypothetical protein [Halomonas halocynthiae]|uniref:hypothetical protein n=1 Tax=Halomonas halocynthiae TaxID=176290 RepID=UPI0004807006|nr:hypothetical protein [Halomonas halocynthiae]
MNAIRLFFAVPLLALSTSSVAAEQDVLNQLFGTWEITETYHCSHICAMDDAEASTYIGMEFSYSRYEVRTPEAVCNKPGYKFVYISVDDWVRGYRFYPTTIGLNDGDNVVAYISCDEPFGVEFTGIGSSIMLKDAETILLSWDGIDFEARKK